MYSPVIDHPSHKVGVRVSSNWNYNGFAPEFWFHAGRTNTFSGGLWVGRNAKAVLCNYGVGPSVVSDIFVNGGSLYTFYSKSIGRDSSVVLSGRGALELGIVQGSIEIIHSLQVSGIGLINFGSELIEHRRVRGEHSLFLDDLVIKERGELIINDWEAELHHILVRKDSVHLMESIGRIRFEGRRERHADFRYYDKDYYEIIPAFPESTSYGAAVVTLGLSLFAWRRKMHCAVLSVRDHAPQPYWLRSNE